MTKTLLYYFSFGILLTIPFAWASWVVPTRLEWIQMFSIGIGTAIAQMLLTLAYRYGTASYLSPIGYTSVIYAGFISWLIFHQTLSLRSWIGTSLIVIGGILTYILKKKPESFSETFKHPDAK